MKRIVYLALSLLVLAACQPKTTNVTALEDGDVFAISGSGGTPAGWLAQAGETLDKSDRVLYLGLPVDPYQALPDSPVRVLQIRRAVTLTLITPEGKRDIQTAAFTVGQALAEEGIALYTGDQLDPPAETLIQAPLTVRYRPARILTIQVGEQNIQTRSAAGSVGQALAEAGMPLEGLDESVPAEYEPLPADGLIRIRRIHETVLLSQKAIPFKEESQTSSDLALGEQEIVEPGEQGLAISRVRIRYADGQEISRQTESETVVRPPKTQIVRTGTKVVLESVEVDGRSLEVWRVLDMYATIYSPCNSGTSGCSYGTASGLRAGRGVVAVDPSMYSYLQGQKIYVPGYGYAVIGDIGGGYIIENTIGVARNRWIDLGFDDNNLVDMTGWVKVYFLAPAPASIPPSMQ